MTLNIEYLKNTKKEIILFGAGRNGEIIYNICLNDNINVKCFCDNNPGKSGKILSLKKEIEIFSLENLNVKNNAIFIITTDRVLSIKEIRKQLELKGYSEIYESIEFFNSLENTLDDIMEAGIINAYKYQHHKSINSDKLYLEDLSLQITERCSLSCKDCTHMMANYTNPQNHNLDKIKEEIDRFSNVFDYINRVSLVGGETLMHKDLFEITDYLYTKSNIFHIKILTNGTICPSEEQIASLDRTKVYFQISNYGKYSINIEKLCDLLSKYNISYRNYDLLAWSKFECCDYQNLSEKELSYMFSHCCAKDYCNILLNGKFFRCPRAANMYNLEIIPHEKSDFIDIMNLDRDSKILEKELKDFFYGRTYINECQYCKGGDLNTLPNIPVAEQVNYVVPYEKYK